MFIGHFALALAAKRAAPRTSAGVLVAAAQFVGLIWPVFLLPGLEQLAIRPGWASGYGIPLQARSALKGCWASRVR